MMKINFDPDIYLFIENLFFLALKIGLKSKCVLCQLPQKNKDVVIVLSDYVLWSPPHAHAHAPLLDRLY